MNNTAPHETNTDSFRTIFRRPTCSSQTQWLPSCYESTKGLSMRIPETSRFLKALLPSTAHPGEHASNLSLQDAFHIQTVTIGRLHMRISYSTFKTPQMLFLTVTCHEWERHRVSFFFFLLPTRQISKLQAVDQSQTQAVCPCLPGSSTLVLFWHDCNYNCALLTSFLERGFH